MTSGPVTITTLANYSTAELVQGIGSGGNGGIADTAGAFFSNAIGGRSGVAGNRGTATVTNDPDSVVTTNGNVVSGTTPCAVVVLPGHAGFPVF
jgi:hypothetical protein